MCLGGRIRCCRPPISKPHIPVEQITIPLTGATGTVKVVDFTAEVTIKQRYENTESDPIEAVYEFPLDSRASVVDFYAEIDNVKVLGEIKEKEKAKDIYDDAIASGHGAYLLEQKENSNLFSASIGNLPPGKEVLVVITYVTELEFENGKVKLVLPATPYLPDGVKQSKFILPKKSDTPYSKVVPYGLRITVDFDMTSNIKSVSSPSHPIQFEFSDEGPQKATVALAQNEEGAPLGKDFELLVALAQATRPVGRVEVLDDKSSVVMAALYPELPEDQVFTEMLFLVDRSGSMSGSRIGQVRDTLQIFLRSLPEGTLFNIIGFGTKFEKLFPESKEYNDSTLATAVQHVEKMSANLGGTNLLSPIQAILAEKPKEGIPRQLFILTDGEVDNTQSCIDTVREHADTTRVFTFGIGADASKQLVSGIAKAGEGQAEFIRSGESMDNKVMKQLNTALKPALTDLKVKWTGNADVQQTPFHLPPLFAGGRLLVYAFYPPGVVPEGDVVMTASTPAGQSTYKVTIDNKNISKSNFISKLAAKSLIRDLEEKRSCYHDNKKQVINKSIDIKQETIRISLKHKVISSYTAFVAVEKREEGTEGSMKLRKMEVADFATSVPSQLVGGGGPLKRLSSSSRGGMPPSVSSSMVRSRKSSSSSMDRGAAPTVEKMKKSKEVRKDAGPSKSFFKKQSVTVNNDYDDYGSEEEMKRAPKPMAPLMSRPASASHSAPAPAAPPSGPVSDTNKLREIIKQQRANGSFSLDALKLVQSSITQDNLKKFLANKSLSDALLELFITAVVLQFIQSKFADQQVNWNLVVKKGQGWLSKESTKANATVDWAVTSNEYLKSVNAL